MISNNQIVVSGAVVCRYLRGERSWLLVKKREENKWEVPKVNVRRGESSVRAAIRMTGEQAGINARVLEEAGRFTGMAVVSGKSIPQRYYYYLMLYRMGGEIYGFEDARWFEYPKARLAIGLKREKGILGQANKVLKEWEKTHRIQNY